MYDNIDSHKVHFDFIFVYQEFQEFNFFYEELTFFMINILLIYTKLTQHESNIFRIFFSQFEKYQYIV